jgi:hypothetical protein
MLFLFSLKLGKNMLGNLTEQPDSRRRDVEPVRQGTPGRAGITLEHHGSQHRELLAQANLGCGAAGIGARHLTRHGREDVNGGARLAGA